MIFTCMRGPSQCLPSQRPPLRGDAMTDRRSGDDRATQPDELEWSPGDRVRQTAQRLRLGHVGEMIALVDVWFDQQADPGKDAPVTVHIGQQRVGVLSPQATRSFIPVMQAATERDAKPRAQAQLTKTTHLQPPSLLVVELPAPD